MASQANSGYQTEQQRKAVAKGLADPARDEKQKPGELVQRHGAAAGHDGGGHRHRNRLHAAVPEPRAWGRQGRVIAEDIFDDFLASAQAARRRTRSWPT